MGARGGRRSRKNHTRADEIAGLLEADKLTKSWWTDRESMTTAAQAKANERNDPCYLYVDDGDSDTLMCVTVQRVPRPEGMTKP